MTFKTKFNTFAATAVIISAVIGAGFLGIPYFVAKSGLLIGAVHIVALGLLMWVVNLYLGEVALRTEGNHQLTGYAEKYLGRTGKTVMLLTLIFGVFSALLAYTFGVAESISYVITGDTSLLFQAGLGVWAFMTLLTFFGIKMFETEEVVGIVLTGAFLAVAIILFAPQIEISNLSYIEPSNFFLPFGAVLFAFISFSAVPEIKRILFMNKEKVKKAVTIGSLAPICFYLLFTFLIIGVTGKSAPEVSTIALGEIFTLLGIVTMSTSYIVLVVVMKSVLNFDYGLPRRGGWAIISLVSLSLFIVAIKLHFSFSEIINAAGIISGSVIGLLSIIMVEQAKKKGEREPEYKVTNSQLLKLAITLVLVIGAGASLLN